MPVPEPERKVLLPCPSPKTRRPSRPVTPRSELEGQMGDTTVGLQARMMSQAMRKLAGNLNRTDTLCLFTNQIREKVGVMFGSPETQPGGRALKFYSSQRLDIRRIETLKEGTEAVGNRAPGEPIESREVAGGAPDGPVPPVPAIGQAA